MVISMSFKNQQLQLEGECHPPKNSSSSFEPLANHMGALRAMILKISCALLLGFALAYFFSESIISFMERPLLEILPPGEQHLYYMGLMEKFFIYMKWSAYAGTFLVSPYIFYQLWKFISPGLYEREKRMVRPFMMAAFLAFVAGVVFAYRIVLPSTFKFLIQFGAKTEKPMINLSQYFSLAAQLVVTTACLFELPVVIVLLGSLGILKAEMLIKYRKHAHVGLSILAAVATPMPDAVSMVLVLIPLCLLYEASILFLRATAKGPKTATAPSN
jgi:sec-independent protein translocase protein TatC